MEGTDDSHLTKISLNRHLSRRSRSLVLHLKRSFSLDSISSPTACAYRNIPCRKQSDALLRTSTMSATDNECQLGTLLWPGMTGSVCLTLTYTVVRNRIQSFGFLAFTVTVGHSLENWSLGSSLTGHSSLDLDHSFIETLTTR
jgi:hypothetical protein